MKALPQACSTVVLGVKWWCVVVGGVVCGGGWRALPTVFLVFHVFSEHRVCKDSFFVIFPRISCVF